MAIVLWNYLLTCGKLNVGENDIDEYDIDVDVNVAS